MCRLVSHCFVSFLFLASVSAAGSCVLNNGSAVPELVFPPKYMSLSPEREYTYKFIQLVLKSSEAKYGPCDVTLYKHNLPMRRTELYLKENQNIHLVALTVRKDRDKKFRPVEIPIAKGMVGQRIFLIRKGDQNRFSEVKSVEDLRSFTAGQGEGWLDVEILEKNGLKVLATDNVHSLQNMLAISRFDYYPLGVLQFRIQDNLPIELESRLLLSYPSMTALYVNKENDLLAERLSYGLKQAIAHGALDDLFFSHSATAISLKDLNMDKRRVIQLCNPEKPEWLPLDIDEYWLHPWPQDICKHISSF